LAGPHDRERGDAVYVFGMPALFLEVVLCTDSIWIRGQARRCWRNWQQGMENHWRVRLDCPHEIDLGIATSGLTQGSLSLSGTGETMHDALASCLGECVERLIRHSEKQRSQRFFKKHGNDFLYDNGRSGGLHPFGTNSN
jgi:hypothetical protein